MSQSEDREAGLRRAVSAGMAGEEVSAGGVLAAIGGWRGVVESLLPASVFLVAYVITRDAKLSALLPVAIGVVAIAWRLIRREPLSGALSGLIGVGICAAAVLFTGDATNYYVPGFFINAAWILIHLVSLLVGWPVIGLLVGFLRGSLTEWRKIPKLRRAVQLTTLFWIAVFVARLAVQLPIYFAAQPAGSHVQLEDALGVARLVMGVPLFALAVLFTWFVLARVSTSVDAEAGTAVASDSEAVDMSPKDANQNDTGHAISSDE